MAKNQSTYTLKIDAELGNLQNIVNKAKSSLSDLMSSGKAPQGLEKAFEKINQLLGQISDKAGGALDLKGLSTTNKDLSAVQENFRAIVRLLGDFSNLSDDIKLSFLSAEEQKTINNITKSLDNYEKSVVETTKKLKELEIAQKALGKDEASLGKAKKNVSALTNKRSQKQAELSGTEGKLAALQSVEGVKPEKIAKYKADILELKAVIGTLDDEIKTANEELVKSQSAYDASAKSVGQLEKQINNATKGSLHELKEQAKAAGVSLEGLNGRDAATQIQILTQRLKDFKQNALKSAEPAFEALKDGFEDGGEYAKEAGEKIEEATSAVKAMDEAASQREALEGKIKQFLGLQGAAQVMRSALRNAISTVKELDATMTEMAVVTDLSVGDYWDQLPEYSARANELGVSINSAYEAATLYYQQGLKSNEVSAISAETLKMAKIAGLDAADATNKMTAALRGFNMELNETSAQRVSDVYSQLAAITAADVNEISNAMTKTASIASSAGMEFETTAAFLSQIIETTRESAETAGTALKTVIARFQELKKDPSEIGEVEGEIVDANAIETALRSVGVSLRDTKGQFRELDDVFLELSSKWDGLDKNTQRYIATIAAGSRQQSRFIAMMQDYSRTQELVTAANNSAGASQKQFEKTMESLEVKLAKLKNAWDEFTMGIMDSDLVKTGIDILTKFLEIINKATNAFDGLGGSISKIAGIMVVFKVGQAIFDKLKAPLENFFAEIIRKSKETGTAAGVAAVEGLQAVEKGDGKASSKGVSKLQSGLSALKKKGDVIRNNYAKNRANKTRAKNRLNKADEEYNNLPIGATDKQREKAFNKLQKEYDKFANITQYTDEEIDEINKNAKQGWNDISSAITEAGVAVSMFGGLLQSLGADKAGEGVAKFGNALMIAGTAMSTILPLVSLLGIKVDSASKKMIIAGIKTQLAWWWVLAIVAALAAMIALIVVIAKKAAENSPEGKLKAAQEAAERASEAADRAKEAYEGLASSIEQLDDKYKALDELTRGTKEWNKAILEANASVMDLIEQYPELAGLVKNNGGVLTLDLESDAVLNVLNKAYEASLNATNVKIAADMNVAEKELAVTKSKLDSSDFQYDAIWKKQGSGRAGVGVVTDTFLQSEGASVMEMKAWPNEIKRLNDEQIDKFAELLSQGAFVDSTSETYAKAWKDLGLDSAAQVEILMDSIEESEQAIRDYGSALLAQKEQERAMYDAMASSVVGLTNTMGMSDDRIQQMYNIADGESYKEAYNKVYDAISGKKVDFIDDSGAQTKVTDLASGKLEGIMTEQQIKNAFENAGYKDYKLDQENGKISYIGADGKRTTTDITEGDIEKILATEYAKNVTKAKADNAELLVNTLVNNADAFGGQEYVKALESALKSEGGEFLSSQNAELLKKEGFLEAVFVDFSERWGDIYNEEEIRQELEKAISAQEAANARATDIFADIFGEEQKNLLNSLTAGSREGLAKKLQEMSYKEANDGQDYKTVKDKLNDFLGLDGVADNIDAITARINATDWSSIEQLNALQHDLYVEYGLTTEATQGLIDTIKNANYATSAYALSVNELTHVRVQQELAESTDRLTKLQYEYNQALRKGSSSISESINDIINERKSRSEKYQQDFANARNNIVNLYAQGIGAYGVERFGMDLSEITTLQQDGSITYKPEDVLKLIQSGELKKDEWDAWLESLEEQRKIAVESEEGIREEIEAIQDLEDELKDSYDDLREQAIEAYTEKLQKQIDIQQEQLDATKSASDKLISKIQEQIEDQRQARENEKTEQDIANQQAQLAYLQMDTSGGNAIEQLELQRQITEVEEDYTDTLIDQSTQSLQDSNERAFEQRERQISLQQQQLDAYLDSADFQAKINVLLSEALAPDSNFLSSELGLIIAEIKTAGMTEEQKNEWNNSISSIASLAASYKNDDEARNSVLTALNNTLSTLNTTLGQDTNSNEGLSNSAYEASYKAAQEKLESAGFSSEGLSSLVSSAKSGDISASTKMGRMVSMAEKDIENQDEIDKLSTNLRNANINVQSKQDYYKTNQQAIAEGSVTASYSDYLKEKVASEKAGLKTTSSNVISSADYAERLDEYIKLGGSEKEFEESMAGKYVYEKLEGFSFPQKDLKDDGLDKGDSIFNFKDIQGGKEDRGLVGYDNKYYQLLAKGGEKLENMPNEGNDLSIYLASSGPLGEKKLYLNNGGTWYGLGATGLESRKGDYDALYNILKGKIRFKTGGLADFTGPAWLDGTPSKPEYILNAAQTERFFSLIDVLENYNKDNGSTKSSGDNYFDINISVEKIEDDYSVEQMADKIRRMIYEDAMYRNVNSINNIR